MLSTLNAEDTSKAKQVKCKGKYRSTDNTKNRERKEKLILKNEKIPR